MAVQDDRDTTSPFDLKVPLRGALLTATGLIFIGLVFLYVETYKMAPPLLPGYPGDAFFPRLVIALSLIFAALILIRGLFLPQDAAAAGNEATYFDLHWLEFVSVIVLVLLYAQFLELIGFEVATFVLLMVLLVPRLRASPGTTIAQAVLQGLALTVPATLILYVGFALFLKIPLPLLFLPRFIQL